MSGGRNILFPRDAVPPDVGARVRAGREMRGWSQERLARRVGVHRRTVMRLEAGLHRPGPRLVQALETALGIHRLVPAWKDAAEPGSASWGPRTREARVAAGITQVEAARAAGVSAATFSRFERELGDTPLILGPFDEGGGIRNESLAQRLGFRDAADMDRYCMSREPGAWLRALRASRQT